MGQSVNDIQLNGLLIEGLYRKSLVVVDEGGDENPPASPPPFSKGEGKLSASIFSGGEAGSQSSSKGEAGSHSSSKGEVGSPTVLKREEKVSPTPVVRFLGNNEKHITVLVNDPGSTFLPEGHLSFLTKILGACKLNIGDVAIVNVAHNTDVKEIVETLSPTKMISFGTEIEVGNIEHVKGPSINELIPESAEAKAQKSKLWSGLKKMFGI